MSIWVFFILNLLSQELKEDREMYGMYIYIYEPNTSIDTHEKMGKEAKKTFLLFCTPLLVLNC